MSIWIVESLNWLFPRPHCWPTLGLSSGHRAGLLWYLCHYTLSMAVLGYHWRHESHHFCVHSSYCPEMGLFVWFIQMSTSPTSTSSYLRPWARLGLLLPRPDKELLTLRKLAGKSAQWEEKVPFLYALSSRGHWKASCLNLLFLDPDDPSFFAYQTSHVLLSNFTSLLVFTHYNMKRTYRLPEYSIMLNNLCKFLRKCPGHKSS